jgi:aminoglycoside 3-N-acetyltransferase
MSIQLTIELMHEQLRALGVRDGGILLVHASMKSLGPVLGGPETVIQGLLSALGPRGTLLFPALSYISVTVQFPFFDVLNTPSCVGLLPEYFRTREGTIRSVHPTHSVSGCGVKAEELLSQHIQDVTPVGPHSPFRLISEMGGQILMLGCGLRPSTSMHGVEELVVPPYLYDNDVEYDVTLANGQQTRLICRRHGFKGWEQRYDRLENVLQGDELRQGKLLQADCQLVESSALWNRALEKLKENPLYFVAPR